MKSKYKTALLGLSGVAMFAAPAMAAISLEQGTLAVAFYQTNAGGNVATGNTFVYDLGQASLYRENTLTNGVSVSTVNSSLLSNNIGAQLQSAFGANWANDSTVRWMVVGIVGPTDSLTNGDPTRTAYLSQGRSSLADGTTGPGTTVPTFSSTSLGTLTTQLSGFFTATTAASQITGANADGVQIATSAINSVEDYMPNSDGTRLTYFGTGTDPRQTLNNGQITGSTVEGALDIYRVLYTTTNADPTSGLSTGNATVRTGQFIGTLTIDGSGNLAIGAVPEPSSTLLLSLCTLLGLSRRKRTA